MSKKDKISLGLELLERRILLAPVAPTSLELWDSTDSQPCGNLVNFEDGILYLEAAAGSTVAVYNDGVFVGNATATGEPGWIQSGADDIVIDVENGIITGMQTTAAGGSVGSYISDTNGDGDAVVQFYVATAGTYYVHGRCYFPGGSNNSFYANIDETWQSGESGPSLWSDTYTSWHFSTTTTLANNAALQSWVLTEGWHFLEMHTREASSRLDRIVISTNSALPAGDGGSESTSNVLYQYQFTAGELNGSTDGAENDITATATNAGTSPASATLTITYDTGTDAPAVPDLDTGSDTGDSNLDNLTNDTTPMFSGGAGSVEGLSTVTLRIGAADVRSITANADGSWSLTLQTGDLAEGINAVDIYYTDLAGNVSAGSDDLSVTLDTTANVPAAAPDLEATSDTGTNNDNITSDTTPTFSGGDGSVENNSTVWLRVNGVNTRSTTATAAGAYSITMIGGDLNEGPNIIDIIYTDPAGNTSPDSANLTVTLDTILATPAAPDLRAASDTGNNADNITSDDAAWFDGYAEPGASVQLFVGVTGKGTATANAATGAWAIQLSNNDLDDGANNITVYVTDTAGNTATSPILVVTYNAGSSPSTPKLLPSTDSGSSNADRITNIAAATVYGSVAGGNPVEANAVVHVRTNKNAAGWIEVGTTASDSSGNWSYTFDGVDDLTAVGTGTNLVDIYIVNLSGVTSSDSNDLTITLDQTAATPAAAPDLTAGSDTGVNNDNITSDTTPTFSRGAGAVETIVTVWLRIDGSNIRSTPAAVNGSYSVTLLAGEMTVGTHIVDIIYVDPAGNISADSPNLTVTLDTSATAPVVTPDLDSASDTGASSTDNLTNDTTATFTAPAGSVEGSATVWLRVGGADTRSGTANADGSFSITLQAGDLAAGANIVDFRFIDQAGNTLGNSPDLTVTLDTTIADPAVSDLAASSDTGTDDTDNITSEIRPTIQGAAGSVEGNSTVRVWLDTPSDADTIVGTTTAAANGSWSYSFTADYPLEEGVNAIHIVAVDTAGNISNPSADLNVTVDFSTGAETAPDLLPASDTGTLANDNITYDNTPTIAGTCPAGAQIKIRINESTIITFTDNNGTDGNANAGLWSYTFIAGALSEGTNTIDFLTIDTAGTTSVWSLDLVLTLDTAILQPAQPDLATSDDSGSNNADNITNDTTPAISGTAEANSTVTININAGAHTGTATVGANGIWSYSITNGWLNEGVNTIYVQAADIAGNTSVASSNLTITLDTTIAAPSQPDLTAATDTGSSSIDNITSHANPRITGTADPNTTITIRLNPDGAATSIGTTTASAAGNWSYIFAAGTLSEGANIIDVLSTDSAGNSLDSANLTITIETAISIPSSLDLQAAADLGDSNTDNLTSTDTPTITGQSDPSCTIYVRVNGSQVGSTTSNGLGNWTYTFDGVDDLIEGTNIIDAWAVDSVGNTSDFSADLVVVLDTAISTPLPPDLLAASDSGSSDTDNYTSDTTSTITGTCETGATILIHLNGVDAFASTTDAADGTMDGFWSYTFAGGLNASATGTANTIKVAQRDVAGNISAYCSTLTITLDTTASLPAVPDLTAVSDTGDLNGDNVTNIPNVTITGTVEVNSSLQLYVDQGGGAVLIDTISEQYIATGNWSYTFSSGQLGEGVNHITVIVKDKAFNISASSAALTITLDTTIAQPGLPDLAAESDTGDIDNDEVTSDETPVFNGVADPNTHVTVRVDGEPIHTVDADGTGAWSYTFAQGEIQSGVHQIDVVATDVAGNVSVPSDDLTIWLNVMPTQPTAPNLQAVSDSGSISTDNLTYVKMAIIDGKADANNEVYVYANDNVIGSTMANANGFWAYTFANGILQEGNNIITIITKDSSGLLSASSLPLTITIDTTQPIAALPDLQAGSDTGVSNTDNRTSDETATLEGTTEPSARVALYLNSSFVTQLTASASGNWTYTFAPGVLAEGNNDIYVTITDVAGNVSASSASLAMFLDLELDSPIIPILSPDTDTGSSPSDGLTNNSNPLISGTVKPNSSVAVVVSGSTVATVQADDSGVWEYTLQPDDLEEGLNHIEIFSTDPVGNIAHSQALDLTLDTTAPLIYNYFPQDNYTQTTNNIELYLNADDLDTLAAADISGYLLTGAGGDGTFGDGNEWMIPVSSVTTDSISGLVRLNTAITLSDDTYRLTINPTISLLDQAGNPASLNVTGSHSPALDSGDEIIITFSFDTAGPPAPDAPQVDSISDSGLHDTDRITNLSTVLVHITAEPDTTVEVICNGRSAGFANETEAGEYQLFIDSSLIREGENLLLARAFDGLGNSSDLSALQTFVYDHTAPQVTAIVVDSLWLNHGPTQISIIFAKNDIDPNSVLSLDNYLLLASGNDGTFDDGNELLIQPTAILYVEDTYTLTLVLPQTVTGTSELGPDRYRLVLPAGSAIKDIAGNGIEQTATQDFSVVTAAVIHSHETYSFITADGNHIKVILQGNGDASILLGEAVGSGNSIEQIVLTNTDEKTSLKITSSSGSLPFSIGTILCDSPIHSISSAKAAISDEIRVQQSISKLLVGAIGDNASFHLVSSNSTTDNDNYGLKIYAGSIGQNVSFNITGHLQSFQADNYESGELTAHSISSLTITQGNLGANLIVDDDLENLVISQGDLSGNLTAGDRIGNIKVRRGTISSSIQAAEVNAIYARDMVDALVRTSSYINKIKIGSGQDTTISAGTDIFNMKCSGHLTQSTLAAGASLEKVFIGGNAIDSLFLSGADLGTDAQLDGTNDLFGDGNLNLTVKGTYLGSIAAAAVNPGSDLTYFTPDDAAASTGALSVKFSKNSLTQTTHDSLFGLLASGSIKPFKAHGQLYQSPLTIDQFRMILVE